LNAAGKRGMHETQIWLAPKAAGNSIVFDPPSSGGIWAMAITDGEEMTEDDPLGQRYLAKDLTPHIEAQEKYAFNDVTDELTFWGAYYYDAVLAAAHALAAAKNRSKISMAKELRKAGVEVTDKIQGYEFTGKPVVVS
jgi:ABC-type branched-subunit amino acid transport system substrate-binding protein